MMWSTLVDIFSWWMISPFINHKNCEYCSFDSIYPKQYISYKVRPFELINYELNGNLNKPFWNGVPFTDDFVDISTTTIPKFQTKAKIRYDDTYLYVGAIINDNSIWANITHTCHCISATENQVIFHDNDFEVFVDPAGTNHYYKEFEMNAANATWDLQLNKPYNDNGYENSSRVYGANGWDMQPPLRCATLIKGSLNDPQAKQISWSVEIAIPLKSLKENQDIETEADFYPTTKSNKVPISSGHFWRINFSRVEWNVVVVGNHYVKDPACQSCPVPGSPNEDNWVWQPMGEISMHQPEKWGMLQFSDDAPGTTVPIRNPEWTVRSVAMIVYYAEHAFYNINGFYTDNVTLLNEYASLPILNSSCCTSIPVITLQPSSSQSNENVNSGFVATMTDYKARYQAYIRDDRYLVVQPYQPYHATLNYIYKFVFELTGLLIK